MAGGKLQRELKKKRPFESPEQEAMLNIVRTGDRLQIHFTRLFREHGLTPSQYNVLAGLVTRQQSQEDRRVYLVTITVRGLGLLAGLDEPVLALHRKLLGHLTESELNQLIRLLEKARSPWEKATD